jgi:hypothetical protein
LQLIYTFFNDNLILLLFILTFVCVFLIVLVFINFITIYKLKKRVNLFFGTNKNKHTIEAMLIEGLEKVALVDSKFSNIQTYIEKIDKDLSLCIQKVGIIRYNPFDNQGGDLSFALAFLDSNNKGVVLNTLHNRENTYTYAKSVSGLESSHPLSEEEKSAIKIAMGQK